MATQHRIDARTTQNDGRVIATHEEPHVRDLLKQLASEGGDLLRNEMALAKLEMRDMAREVALDSARLGAALGLALMGGLTLVAALVIGIGHALDGRFGLAALIVGVVLLIVGGVLAKSGVAGLKKVHGPEQTKRTLQEDRTWARRELQEFKQEVRS